MPGALLFEFADRFETLPSAFMDQSIITAVEIAYRRKSDGLRNGEGKERWIASWK
jgi:hypothetical protein